MENVVCIGYDKINTLHFLCIYRFSDIHLFTKMITLGITYLPSLASSSAICGIPMAAMVEIRNVSNNTASVYISLKKGN